LVVPIRRVFRALNLAGIVVATICLAAQLAIITVNVILRYVFNSGISWIEEISTDVLMTAFTFIAMAIGVTLDSHINVDLFPRNIPAWLDKALRVLKQLVVGGVGFFLARYGFSLLFMLKGSIASVPSLPILLQYILIPFSGFLILAESLLNLFGVPKGEPALDELFMGIGEKK
jgi:TRAP-type C4-dicarboxylate transport system permease small subunit